MGLLVFLEEIGALLQWLVERAGRSDQEVRLHVAARSGHTRVSALLEHVLLLRTHGRKLGSSDCCVV